MSTAVRIDDAIYQRARIEARSEHRTIAGQIEFWALVGKTALDNPDLPIEFVRDLLFAKAEGREVATPFIPQGRQKHG